MEYIVYGIYDKSNDQLKYIGSTKRDLDRRIKQHMNAAQYYSAKKYDNIELYDWIKSVNFNVEFRVLARFETHRLMRLGELLLIKSHTNLFNKIGVSEKMGKTGAKRHIHRYMRINGIWYCSFSDCTHYMPLNIANGVLGKQSICFQCGNQFVIDETTIKEDQPICLECTIKLQIGIDDMDEIIKELHLGDE